MDDPQGLANNQIEAASTTLYMQQDRILASSYSLVEILQFIYALAVGANDYISDL